MAHGSPLDRVIVYFLRLRTDGQACRPRASARDRRRV